jgi:hypothetical protein
MSSGSASWLTDASPHERRSTVERWPGADPGRQWVAITQDLDRRAGAL